MLYIVEVFSTRRNQWEEDGGSAAYTNQKDAEGHVRSVRALGTASKNIRIAKR